MKLYNNTVNQHYISQAEQRLNTSTPNSSPENMKIFSYSVVNRNSYSLRIDSDAGQKICNNLSYDNLYRFHHCGTGNQGNFESLFGEYEKELPRVSAAVFDKLINGIEPDETLLKELFKVKFLNFIRNPYCITKILNTFGAMLGYYPLNASAKKQLDEIVSGIKPQKRHVSQRYGVTQTDYDNWLRTIFMLLYPLSNNAFKIYDDLIEMIFEDANHKIIFTFGVYTNGSPCLLSDRGFTILEEDPAKHFSIEFNLCSKCHFGFSMININSFIPSALRSRLGVKRIKDLTRATINPHLNSISLLNGYNARVIYQANKHVFCSQKIDCSKIMIDSRSIRVS